jgi:hypothetical protein
VNPIGVGALKLGQGRVVESVCLRRPSVNWVLFVSVVVLGFAETGLRAAGGSNDVDRSLDLLLNALRNQGRNPTLIQRGEFVWEEREQSQGVPEAEIQANIANARSFLEDQVRGSASPSERKHWEDQLRILEPSTRASAAPRTFVSLNELYFEGNNPRTIFIQTSEDVGDSPGHRRSIKHLAVSGPEAKRTSVLNPANGGSVTIGLTWGWTQVECFGRPRGSVSLLVSGLLSSQGGDPSRIEFAEASVEQLKKYLHAVDQTHGRLFVPHVVGSQQFEGAEMFIVQCGQPQAGGRGKEESARNLRMGIVPEKGYVCPFEEEYVDGRLVVRFEAADYRLESDRFWFPRRCKDTYFDESGQVRQQTEYAIKKVAINEKATPRPFAVPVGEGDSIADFRGGDGRSAVASYKATTAQNLVLREDGSVDLSSPGLRRMKVLAGRRWAMPSFSWKSWLAVVNGLVLLALLGVFGRKAVLARRSEQALRGRRDRR